MKKNCVDELDKALLRLMQRDCRMSTEALGAEVGLSASACQRRIKRLKREGVIEKEVAVIDPGKLSGVVTLIIDVTLKQGGELALDSFINSLQTESQVQQLYYTAGSVDFVVIVVAADMLAYDKLSRKLFMANDNVLKFESKVAINSIKQTLALPIL